MTAAQRPRHAQFLAAALLIATGLAACGDSQPAGPDLAAPAIPVARPDVVVILIDTLRPDHLQVYGYEKETAPFLDGFAQRSSVFRRAYSTSSWTAPSTASLFTSLYPPRHGVMVGLRASRASELKKDSDAEVLDIRPLPATISTLPEIFKEAGYATFGLAANANISSDFGFDRGFDRFALLKDGDATDIAQRLRSWREEIETEQPTLIYLHFNDVHSPFARQRPWYKAEKDKLNDSKARYDSEIRYLDETLRVLYEEFAWNENTIVCVVSDHGEEFRDHGQLHHRFSLYRELNQVVMLLQAPGFEPSSLDANVSLIDVLPTLCELSSVPAPNSRVGRSLVPQLLSASGARPEDAQDLKARTLYAHRRSIHKDGDLWAAIRGPWKLIENDDEDTRLLFNLEQDPGETQNLIDTAPDVAADLGERLARFRETGLAPGSKAIRIELDRSDVKRLRSLGYVDVDEDE